MQYQPMTAQEVAQLQKEVVEEQVWETLPWGSYGPEGKDKLKNNTLAQLGTDHLEAILITQPHLTNLYRAAIIELLKIRYTQVN
jgi:hypothetical protein